MLKTCVVLALIGAASATTYLKESFDGDWQDRWVTSDWKESEGNAGAFDVATSDWYGDADAAKALHTTQDARFYTISTKFDEFSNKDKDLVIQFEVKHAQKIDCGGGYIKLAGPDADQAHFSGDSDYNIMFGPDICGSSTKRVHAIFSYKGTNHLIKKTVSCETDQLSHVYTLIVKPDQTYEIRIDGKKKESGDLTEDWDFLEVKEIKDPEQSKPKDWVDESQIDDPEDEKPAGYDDIEAMIADPEAEKPDDWDDEADGEWEAPMLDNPEYQGEWTAKQIPNPEYKGVWVHPMIANPDFVDDSEIYSFTHGVLAFDLWQVKAGTFFDNIIITDSIEESEAFLEETWGKHHEAEKEMFETVEEKRREEEAEERKKLEEERKLEEEDEEDDEDDEDEDDFEEHDEL